MTVENPAWYRTVGIILAVCAGFLVGSSAILQKKGLQKTRKIALETGNEFAYLKSKYWWMGTASMALGEVLNFVAYAFSPAIVVAPLMAVSVVVSAIMSVIFLGEKLNFTATAGIILCVLGSVIIVLHAPESTATETLPQFFGYVFQPGFICFALLCFGVICYLVLRVGPKYGHVHPVVYISTTALVGAYLVSSAQGMGAAALYSINHWETDNQFRHWGFYPLLMFVAFTVVFQINYLNKALAHFSATIVTPLNYVFFSTATLVTNAVLYQGFNVKSAVEALTVVMGFFVIVIGVSLLFQYNLKMSKLNQSARPVEDINDHEPIPVVYKLEDDDPLKLLSEIFPVNAGGVQPTHDAFQTSVAARSMDETSPEAYVRPEDSKQEVTGKLMTALVPLPQYSISEQIQNREAKNEKFDQESIIEIDPPIQKSATFGSLLGSRFGLGLSSKFINHGSQEFKQSSKAKSGSNIDTRSFMNGFGSKTDRASKQDLPMGETKSLNSHVLKRISMVSSEESIGELVRDRSASSGDQPVLSDSGALKSSSNPNLFNQHNAMLIKEVSLKNDISAVAKVGEMESDSEYSRS